MTDYRTLLVEDARHYQNAARRAANATQLAMLLGDTVAAIEEQAHAYHWAKAAQRALGYLLESY